MQKLVEEEDYVSYSENSENGEDQEVMNDEDDQKRDEAFFKRSIKLQNDG